MIKYQLRALVVVSVSILAVSCLSSKPSNITANNNRNMPSTDFVKDSDVKICRLGMTGGSWEHQVGFKEYALEARRRGYTVASCYRLLNKSATQVASTNTVSSAELSNMSKAELCRYSTYGWGTYSVKWDDSASAKQYVTEAKKRRMTLGYCRQILDAPTQIASTNTTSSTSTSVPASGKERILSIQQMLNELGYKVGQADGILGSRTTNAITAFQSSQNGYAGSNSEISERLITALNIAVQSRTTSLQQITTKPTDQSSIDVASLGKRVALVIGNSNYSVGPLRNPKNDARLMERTLKAIGFDVFTETDGTYRGMRKAIVDFGRKLKQSGKSTVGLVFYAGHGIQANGKNYLIPVDAEFEDEADLEISAVDANWILAKMDVAQNDLNFLILDACRDNPFARAFRSASRGLLRMDAPRGTIIAYATRPGDVAADGDGVNSPYTLALSKAMLRIGVTASSMFISTRNEVLKVTKEKQSPWEEGGLTSEFYFAGRSSQ